MGAAQSSTSTSSFFPMRTTLCEEKDSNSSFTPSTPPPERHQIETIDQKAWRKFSQQPLVPIGCVATAYFLASGIKSFRDRDPIKSQRMMKYRVMAQFVTLMCFVGYMGLDRLDFRVAPRYQDLQKAKEEEEKN